MDWLGLSLPHAIIHSHTSGVPYRTGCSGYGSHRQTRLLYKQYDCTDIMALIWGGGGVGAREGPTTVSPGLGPGTGPLDALT